MKILIIICALLLQIANTKVYVKAQPTIEKVRIRIGEAAQLKFPTFPFENIYSKWVNQIDSNNAEVPYQYCYQVDEKMSFFEKSQLRFDFQRKSKDIIYDFQDIKYRQGVIDAIVIGNMVYVVFQNANLTMVSFDKDGKLSQATFLQFPNVSHLSHGKFVRINNHNAITLIFVTLDKAYAIQDKIHPIQNYQGPATLNNAIGVLDNYVAIAAGADGILIYKYDKRSLINLYQIGKAFLMRPNNQINIADFAYNQTTSILYALDEQSGVKLINLTIVNETLNVKFWINSTSSILRSGCDNILLFNESIYLTCGQIYKYEKRDILQIPDPLFKVKEIYAFGKFFIVFGQNIFKVYYGDNLVEYEQYDDMDKFFLYDNFYIGINQYGINYGSYDFAFKKIICIASNPKMEGTVNILLKTEAECNQGYFKQYNINTIPDQNDVCVYTVPIQIQYWIANDVQTKVIIAVVVILAVLIISILIWAALIRRNRSNLQAILQKYMNPNEVQKGYNNMVQEKQEQKKDNKMDEQKRGNLQIEVKHDIGE